MASLARITKSLGRTLQVRAKVAQQPQQTSFQGNQHRCICSSSETKDKDKDKVTDKDKEKHQNKEDATPPGADAKTAQAKAEDAMKYASAKAGTIKEGLGKGSQNLSALFTTALKGYKESMKTVKESKDKILGKDSKETSEKLEMTKKRINANLEYATKAGARTVLSQSVAHVHKELLEDDPMAKAASPYQSPVDRRREVLEKRGRREQAGVDANYDSTQVTVRKQSAWENFVNKVSDHPSLDRFNDWKVEWEESDSFLARSTRRVKEGLEDSVGGLMEETEMAYVLDEIRYVDPTFNEQDFILHCERVVFPAIVEAWLSGDKDVLKDWCSQSGFQMIASDIDFKNQTGLRTEFKILDLGDTVVIDGKMDDESPLITLHFQVTQNMIVRNKSGEIIEGNENEVSKVHYFAVMRRDQKETDPLLAWEVHMCQPQATFKMLM